MFMYAQKSNVLFLDQQSEEPIIGLQIFSENGSFVANTNSKGVFELDIKMLQQGGVKSIIAYNTDYVSLEFKLNEVPSLVYLKRNEMIQLDPVTVSARKLSKYFTVKAYFRSWKLENGKLIRYGDGLVSYRLPYADVRDNYSTGVKSNFSAYRTFNADAVKQKSRIIRIEFLGDDYLNVSRIPKNDLLKSRLYYEVDSIKDGYGAIYNEGKRIGFANFDENNVAQEINVHRAFEGEDSEKIVFWEISGKSTMIEKWTGVGEARHPNYLFNNYKKAVKAKDKFSYIETVTEIFIDDAIIDGDQRPENSKKDIDGDRSFYTTNYWEELLMKYPLPSEITSQLIEVNENKNIYK
ncbi:hypothetical protein Celal_0896 [Cellulophaga algicola DSM 14237]|uniref:Carboxypeptidase-like regulatory domain-containing protein n=1 Tax=Cellulophaga algicola (strain DSM 14237 / IC166 / ACAM 630) TaxID=688270 RepID=E6X3S0_CELAD|nr:hypothetical protein [Cellulophaga algicola]ADV48223.1 hypothetical protein Celal_0896 [Cellulophaga algicola DSM 14237]